MPTIDVTYGELLDKWTILEIKKRSLKSVSQKKNIENEMSRLAPQIEEAIKVSGIQALHQSLYEVNFEIWNLMEELYGLQTPNVSYVALTLKITEMNQERAFLKRKIDEVCQSDFTEAKSYFENPHFLIRKH
jgi:hypothetical protein